MSREASQQSHFSEHSTASRPQLRSESSQPPAPIYRFGHRDSYPTAPLKIEKPSSPAVHIRRGSDLLALTESGPASPIQSNTPQEAELQDTGIQELPEALQEASTPSSFAATLNSAESYHDEPDQQSNVTSTGEMDSEDTYADRLRHFHRQDTDRDNEFIRLYNENAKLRIDNKALCQQFGRLLERLGRLEHESSVADPDEDQKHSRSFEKAEARAKAAERNLWEARQAMSQRPFVYVLIDGSGYYFTDAMGNGNINGYDRGLEAAKKTEEEVFGWLGQYGEARSWTIIVRIYVDLTAAKTASMRQFAYGFSQAFPCFDIIDTGPPHDMTFIKIVELFHLAINNRHCKHVFFGCTHDRRYINVLTPYADNPIHYEGITLISSGAVVPVHFQPLPFKIVNMSSMFFYSEAEFELGDPQSHALSRNSSQQAWSSIAEDEYVHDMNGTPDASEARKMASPDRWIQYAGGRPARNSPKLVQYDGPSDERSELKDDTCVSTWKGAEPAILLNIDGFRLDRVLGPCDSEAVVRVSKLSNPQHLCNDHYLKGECTTKGCPHRHNVSLDEKELAVVAKWARHIFCGKGPRCRSKECYRGHICPNMPGCTKKPCLFAKTHNFDRSVIKVER